MEHTAEEIKKEIYSTLCSFACVGADGTSPENIEKQAVQATEELLKFIIKV